MCGPTYTAAKERQRNEDITVLSCWKTIKSAIQMALFAIFADKSTIGNYAGCVMSKRQ